MLFALCFLLMGDPLCFDMLCCFDTNVKARGNERKAIYRSDSDRAQFLELLGEASENFGVCMSNVEM